MRRPPKDERSRAFLIIKEEERASRIREYWSARGYAVETEVVEVSFSKQAGQPVIATRSDMVNGLPARRVSQARK